MKKMIASLMAAAMFFGAASMTAFADSSTGNGKTQKEIGVKAKYVDSVTGGEVISIDLEWGAMEFTYTESGTKTWNPATHTYDVSTSTEWAASGNTISLTNHSNAAVTASFAYAKATGFDAVTGAFSNASVNLPSAEGKAVDASDLKSTVTFNLAGTLDSSATDFTQVGTITVTLA